jgi:hypothetical protein
MLFWLLWGGTHFEYLGQSYGRLMVKAAPIIACPRGPFDCCGDSDGSACAIEDMMSGFFDLDGKIPCQVDGGLKCFGHPIGASGLRMLYAMYEQLLERVPEERKVRNARIGLPNNLGGTPWMNVSSIAVIGKD